MRAGLVGYDGCTFSTGNHVNRTDEPLEVKMLPLDQINPIFGATAEAVEESIINALTSAETMTGLDGRTAHALPHKSVCKGRSYEFSLIGSGRVGPAGIEPATNRL